MEHVCTKRIDLNSQQSLFNKENGFAISGLWVLHPFPHFTRLLDRLMPVKYFVHRSADQWIKQLHNQNYDNENGQTKTNIICCSYKVILYRAIFMAKCTTCIKFRDLDGYLLVCMLEYAYSLGSNHMPESSL